MPIITLPDGSQRQFDNPVSTLEVAQSIGPGLAKATIAGRVDGNRVDACDLIEQDASLEIITVKDEVDGLEIVRHSCAHYLVTRSSSFSLKRKWRLVQLSTMASTTISI